jgi:hypothetical protein
LPAAFVIDIARARVKQQPAQALIESTCLFALTEENNFDEWRGEEGFPPSDYRASPARKRFLPSGNHVDLVIKSISKDSI